MQTQSAPPVSFEAGGAFFSPQMTVKILTGIFLLGVLLVPLSFSKTASGGDRPNVLLITIDTLRPDRISSYSSKHLKTPNIDRLAQSGVVFTRAFAHTPMTLPSHANIFLGATPLYHGVHDNAHFIVDDEFLTLAEHLKADGYSTGAFVGAFPLDSRFGLKQGFDVYDDNYGYKSLQEFSYVERRAEVVVNKAKEWIDSQEGPWFCWIHCFDPHQRYDPPEPFREQFKGQSYNGEVAYVDFSLGQLFDYLEEKNIYDKSLIIFTGDHGESLDEHGEPTHGYFAYNSTLWIPLIISFPDVKAGKVEQNVCHSDIFPTICDVVGIKKPSFLQGVSLMDAAKGKKIPRRRIYFEALYANLNRGWAPLKGYIDGFQKFIDSPIPEFYDLSLDFDETQNVIDQKQLSLFEKNLDELTGDLSLARSESNNFSVDVEAFKKLKSLGYLSSIQATLKENYTAEDDLKTLLPYQIKLQDSLKAYNGGRFSESISLLIDIIAERKDFDQAYSHLATLYKEQGKLKEAVNTLKEGLEHNPSNYKIISTYGILLVEAGQYDSAIEIFKRGLALIDYDPDLWNYMGVAYWSKEDFQNALEAYNQALLLDDNYPVVFNNLGSLYLSQALKSKQVSDLQIAIQKFKKAIELDPTYASAHNGLGTAYGKMGDIESAVVCWKKAVELKPDFPYPLYNLGVTLLTNGDKPQALEYLEDYKKIFYSRLPAHERERLDELIESCRKK
ncbi:MAG: sulfatase-like hydrolase/transferase [Candidatus Aminicenantes bacterium]|nr:sulfatase-like hydrolase/transferase [Candidatus Aminicenantes bacterium]